MISFRFLLSVISITLCFQQTCGNLSASVDVLDLDPEGRLRLPQGTKRIWLEVGCNARDTLSTFAGLPENQDVLLVQFEPLLDKYAALLAANTKPEVASRLGFSGSHTVVLPFAVSPGALSTAPFHVAALDGCSSLLEPSHLHPHDARNWGHLLSPESDMSHVIAKCQQKVFTTMVPSMSLEYFLNLVFGHPGGKPKYVDGGVQDNAVKIEYLKIDAQGFDLQVAQSLGPYISHVANIEIEVSLGGLQLYQGAASPEEFDAFFFSHGLVFIPTCVFYLNFNINSVPRTHAYLHLKNLTAAKELLRPSGSVSSYEVNAVYTQRPNPSTSSSSTSEPKTSFESLNFRGPPWPTHSTSKLLSTNANESVQTALQCSRSCLENALECSAWSYDRHGSSGCQHFTDAPPRCFSIHHTSGIVTGVGPKDNPIHRNRNPVESEMFAVLIDVLHTDNMLQRAVRFEFNIDSSLDELWRSATEFVRSHYLRGGKDCNPECVAERLVSAAISAVGGS